MEVVEDLALEYRLLKEKRLNQSINIAQEPNKQNLVALAYSEAVAKTKKKNDAL